MLIGDKLSSTFQCTLKASEAAGICELAGLGPEDPAADACALALASALNGACIAAVKEGGEFTQGELLKHTGCA